MKNLYAKASDPLIWELHPQPTRYQREVFTQYFAGGMASGGALVILDARTGELVGASRFYDFNPDRRQVSIGYTF